MRSTRWLPLLLALACSSVRARPSTSVPPVNQPLVGPQAALERFAEGYRDRDPDSVLVNLTQDFRFHSMGDTLMQYAWGNSREAEAQTIRALLRGVIRDGDTLQAPADSVGMIVDGIGENVDPEHPDSTQRYRVLTVRRFELGMRIGGTRFEIASALQVFHLVRGDVALLAQDQPADSTRWYIRRWLEDVTGLNAELARQEGACGEPPAAAPGPRSGGAHTPAIPNVLGVRALTNPACAKLEVACDLPGVEPARVEVYDVNGRRVNRRDVDVAAAGTMTIEAGRGAKISPGVYWVRVGQGLRPPVTRMVVVAR